MKDSLDKIYFDLINDSNMNLIQEGKFTNSVLAGIAGLGITAGGALGLNKASEHTVQTMLDKYPTTQVSQNFDENDDVKPLEEPQIVDDKNQTKNDNHLDLTSEEEFIARVLYSETSYKATYQEILMVCQVIINRIGKRDFGNGQNAFDVVKVKNAFSCINDSKNSNWKEFKPNLNSRSKLCCKLAKELMSSDIKSNPLFNNDEIVYYHDKSIDTPEKWTNRFWRPVQLYKTKNFQFYKIVPNKK